ncbi:MAG TPA: glycosyltransferase family 2 protein [Polyangiaceae bacterium]|jgi:biofilm PGA synthesis N-glycosyltransferase PgaC|nr:glycosyltransferase family 2 protein [Polyangiaceae bacterium]
MTAVGLAALLLILYTYAGYPVLVAVWARVAPRAGAARDDFEPTVSVCIAIHDGAEYLPSKLQSLQMLDYPRDKLEILIYSDGSTDATARIARELSASDPRVKVLSDGVRRGKPTALNRLYAEATGEVLLMTDVRQQLAPCALRALLRLLADPGVGCVSGSLVLEGNTGPSAYWRYEKFIRASEARLGSMVGVSGSLYAVRRADFDELPADVLLDDMFVPLRIARRHKSVVLSREAEAYDAAQDDDREFSRKVRTLAGNYQLVALLPWLLVPGRNPVWFQMFSHKLLRLVCPWALLILFGSSLVLASASQGSSFGLAFWRMLALGQLLFYALAALGPRAGRVASLARTFVVLNAAALVGLWRFARGSQAVTW